MSKSFFSSEDSLKCSSCRIPSARGTSFMNKSSFFKSPFKSRFNFQSESQFKHLFKTHYTSVIKCMSRPVFCLITAFSVASVFAGACISQPVTAAESEISPDDTEDVNFLTNSEDIKLDPGDIFVLCSLSATGDTTSFRSTDSYTASVDEQGVITARHPGECDIIITSGALEIKAHVTVSSPEKSGELSLKGSGFNNSEAGLNVNSGKSSFNNSTGFGSRQPDNLLSLKELTLYPSHPFRINDMTEDELKNAVITSSDSSVAYFDMGCIFPLRPGKALLSARLNNGVKRYQVTVIRPVIKLAKKKISIKKGQKHRIKYYISNGGIPEFKSSKRKTASVNCEGVICGKKKGKATITVSCDGVSEKLRVKVKAANK